MNLPQITTKDILAVVVVLGAIVFNGVSLWFGKDADVGTMTLAGAIIGHYFKGSGDSGPQVPLAKPYTGVEDDEPQ